MQVRAVATLWSGTGLAGVAARLDPPGLRGPRARLPGPVPGGIQLAALTTGDVQAMFTAIARDEAALGHPVGAAALHRIHATRDRCRAVYFPTSLEAFGFPLAEARAQGRPVIAAGTAQNREIAGHALCGYSPGDRDSLRHAINTALAGQAAPDPGPFDPDAYFDWMLGAAPLAGTVPAREPPVTPRRAVGAPGNAPRPRTGAPPATRARKAGPAP